MQFHQSFPRKNNTERPQPEVADREPETPSGCPDALNISIDPKTEELEDLASFKVFLKKNLVFQAPPQDLLSNIYDRIDQIKADNTL